MKRFASVVLTLAVLFGTVSGHAAGPSERWQAVKEQCGEADLRVTWYPEYEGLMRRYGTDRMLLVEEGKSYLCKLNSNVKLAGPFDAFGEFNKDGHAPANKNGLAPACQNGRWGMVDIGGKTVVDFLYDTQVQAEKAWDLTPAIPETVDEDALHEGLRRVQTGENGSWGFVNETGEQTVPALFDAVGYFDHGYASVLVDGVFGLLRNPLLNVGSAVASDKDIAFTDVPAGSWFEKGVMTCARSGVMVGTGENTFSPNATLTDAECVMLAYRIYDQALGGDGALMKMPEDYGYFKLASDDGTFVREGYLGERSPWQIQNFSYSAFGYRLCFSGYYPVGLGAATLTFGGREYRGELRPMYRGSGRYEQDRFLGFEPDDPALNDLIFDVYFDTAPPTRWWADLLYTIRERDLGDWDGVFSGATLLFGDEESRGGFADLLGAVTDLPKRFDVPAIPDRGPRSGDNPYIDHLYELYEAGIIGGVDAYGTFESEKTLTRAEAAVMVARVLDESQRLTQPPQSIPAEGEGYTLTYLMDGTVETGFELDTYPYYFVEDPALEWPQRHKGFLKLDGTFTPWPESETFFTLERFGGDTIYWTNIYEPETKDGPERYETGVMNDKLEWIIKPQYQELWPWEGGYAAVTEEERYLLLNEKGDVIKELSSREELPRRPSWTGYHGHWKGWRNWGGLLAEGTYYRWSDGTPATEKFDFCGKIGPDGRGFVQKDGKIYRIQFDLNAEKAVLQPERPTVPPDAAEGTEYLYDFDFYDRYNARVDEAFGLAFYDEETKTGGEYILLMPVEGALEGATVESIDGDGLTPYQLKRYKQDGPNGSLVVGVHAYPLDGVEYISYLWTDRPGMCLADWSSLEVGAPEKDLVWRYSNLRPIDKGEAELDWMSSHSTWDFDEFYVWQPDPPESNDCRDITFYMKDGKVAAIEMTAPFELRYVYGHDKGAELQRAEERRHSY